MATGTIQRQSVLTYSLGTGNTITLTMRGNTCIIFGMRRGTNSVLEAMMIEYWNGSPWHFGNGTTSGLTVTKSSNSKSFTLKNEGSAGAISLIIIEADVTP